ncbi:MAG: GTPase [Planctomycetaceae bacterium]
MGGPLAELQVPASAPLVAALVAEACRHGARLARGGEFTLRAFLAGRLDLEQAEAVLGVVDARTPEELAAALDRMAGGAGTALRAIRSMLIDLVADVEAAIDFADETAPDAVPVADATARRSIADRLGRLRADVAAAAATLARRDAGSGHGLPRVVLVGRPNIGKSSLFNALVGHGAALVADEPGTTRDWLEAPLEGGAGGPACVVVDVAGITAEVGPTGGPAAAAGAVARAEVTRADVLVACRDAGDHDTADAATALAGCDVPRIDVLTRCDRSDAATAGTAVATSVVDGRGIDELRSAIRAAVAVLPPRAPAATVRLAAGLQASAAALDAAARDLPADDAVAAGHLRRALAALDEVTGVAIGTDLLDRIFSRHCVGK